MSYINPKLEEYRRFLKGKTAAVLGVGISNAPLIEFLLSAGAVVTARDSKTKEALCAATGLDIGALEKRGVKFITGEDYLCGINEQIVYKSPGIRFDRPEILNAYNNGSFITSEMEAFLSLCPSKIIAVTGSDGKTTTTTLVSEMLKASGKRVWLGGNIGKPLLSETEKIRPEDFTVLELSSFQLHTVNRFENKGLPFSHLCFPDAAIITNLSPNHLNWHTDMDEYVEAKKAIFKSMKKGAVLVTNALCEITAKCADEAKGLGIETRLFSSDCSEQRISLKDGAICFDGEQVIKTSDIILPGRHNIENYMAAIGAVYEYVSKDDIKRVAQSFGGVEHRLELVETDKNGVKYYNSSIDSSPTRTCAALGCFAEQYNGKIILILGGKDKNLSFDALAEKICAKVKAVVISHDTPEKKIERSIKNCPSYSAVKTSVTVCSGFDRAVEYACGVAKSGDVVLLSPACTSFDEFSNFEQRGRRFKHLVRETVQL